MFGTMGIVVCYLKSLMAFHELQARMRSRLTFHWTLASMAARALMKGICAELFLFFTTFSVCHSSFKECRIVLASSWFMFVTLTDKYAMYLQLTSVANG